MPRVFHIRYMLMPCVIKWDPLNDYTEAHISVEFIPIYDKVQDLSQWKWQLRPKIHNSKSFWATELYNSLFSRSCYLLSNYVFRNATFDYLLYKYIYRMFKNRWFQAKIGDKNFLTSISGVLYYILEKNILVFYSFPVTYIHNVH